MCRADDVYPNINTPTGLVETLTEVYGIASSRSELLHALSFASERVCVAVPLLRVVAHIIGATARLMACRQLRYIRVSSLSRL